MQVETVDLSVVQLGNLLESARERFRSKFRGIAVRVVLRSWIRGGKEMGKVIAVWDVDQIILEFAGDILPDPDAVRDATARLDNCRNGNDVAERLMEHNPMIGNARVVR